MATLKELLAEHPEMTPTEITRVRVNKVPDQQMRDGLLALVEHLELIDEFLMGTHSPDGSTPAPEISPAATETVSEP